MSTEDLIEAVKTGDIASLESILTKYPKKLQLENPWATFTNSGVALLHLAADCNQPKVIEYLVTKKKVDVNQQLRQDSLKTPLHYAAYVGAYHAAAMLLKLGASPALKNAAGDDTAEFCQSELMQALLDPDYYVKKRQKKIDGTWPLTTPKEVMHKYKLPGDNCLLTDTFNFEMRFWREKIKDLDDKGIAVSINFFDDMPDKAIVRQAFDKLKELGGDADEALIENRITRGKPLPPKLL